jgi:hypothetical protein
MRYFVYGLTIESEILVSSLPQGVGDPQVIVRLAPVEKPACGADAPRAFVSQPGEFRIYWRGVGAFFIRQGRDILVEPEPGVEESVVQLYLFGPVLALLLHQRGFLVLHASVVSLDGVAVGFLGEKGWGKSTMAATLNSKGHALVADDLLVITPDEDETPLVQPGPPHFKLWPEAAEASFGDDPKTLARLHSQTEKRTRSAHTGCLDEPLPLGSIYILERGIQLESVRLPPNEALLALVRHSYLSEIMKSLGGLADNFRQCVHLVRRVPVSTLKRPKDLNALRNIACLVEEEVASHWTPADRCALAATR